MDCGVAASHGQYFGWKVNIMAKKQRAFKPKFDVAPTATSAPIHWFALKKKTGVDLDIKRIEFAVGSIFREEGYEVPENADEKLCALISLKDESRQSTLRGDWTWVQALVTQTVAGDLYAHCVALYCNHELECDTFASTESKDIFHGDLNVRIEHSVDDFNKGRTRYKLVVEQ